jgi:putative ABC transport system substrate-binding protein
MLGAQSRAFAQPTLDDIVDDLRQLGWVDGENLAIEYRLAEGQAELLAELAAELVRLPVELILALAGDAAEAASQVTTSIPIVFDSVDPLLHPGILTSRAHPGGNVIGASGGTTIVPVKSVELFKTVLPQLSRLAILGDSTFEAYVAQASEAARTAQELGVQTLELDVRGVEDVDRRFVDAKSWGAEGLVLLQQPSFTAGVDARVAELAARNQLPAMNVGQILFVTENGGLMGYGADPKALHRQAAEYVDKILRGARAGDLPVEEPRAWDFAVNVRTAQALGLIFPPDAAAQVTQWFQE